MVILHRNIMQLTIIVCLAVAPTAGALAYYFLTKNPAVRPLGITRESLDAFARNGGAAFEIVAMVAYDPRHADDKTRTQLHQTLVKAFRAKGVHVNVEFQNTSSAGIWITYVIGPSTLGPYPLSEASDGINRAVEAYRMTVKAPVD